MAPLMDVSALPGDRVAGALVKGGEPPRLILLAGDLPDVLPGRPIARGAIVIRYALAYLYEQDYLIPGYVLDDFRREFYGEAALDFLLARGESFPRADVTGLRVSLGEHETLFVKQLDLAQGPIAIAYRDASGGPALGPVRLAINLDPAAAQRQPASAGGPFPARLLKAAACYSVAADGLDDLIGRTGQAQSRPGAVPDG